MPKLSELVAKRRVLGLTQAQLAEQVDISQSAVAKIEKGRMVPNYNMAKRLFEALEHLERGAEKTAGDIMKKKVCWVGPDDPLGRAAEMMTRHGISNLPVLEAGVSVGRITDGVVIAGGRENYDKACRKVMGPSLPAVPESTPAGVVRELLKRESLVVVTGEAGKVRGVVSRSDIL